MNKKIMVIDDSSAIRNVVSMVLKSQEYEIIEAIDGIDALKKLQSDIDLFLCDVNMPNMNGMEFLKEIKNNKDYKFTPFVMLTTESGQDVKVKAKELGAKAWLVKPFQPADLLDVIKKLIL